MAGIIPSEIAILGALNIAGAAIMRSRYFFIPQDERDRLYSISTGDMCSSMSTLFMDFEEAKKEMKDGIGPDDEGLADEDLNFRIMLELAQGNKRHSIRRIGRKIKTWVKISRSYALHKRLRTTTELSLFLMGGAVAFLFAFLIIRDGANSISGWGAMVGAMPQIDWIAKVLAAFLLINFILMIVVVISYHKIVGTDS